MFGTKEVIKYQVVEVERPRPLEASKEIKESVLSLAMHPGFNYLLNRLKLQKAFLQKQLCEGRHDNLADIHYLQSGIFWCGWLEQELTKAQPQKPPAEANFDEIAAFEEAQARLDVVGIE